MAGAVSAGLLATMIATDDGELPGIGSSKGLLGLGAPGAIALWGVAELTTGRPLLALESSWAALSGWQRFLGGTALVIVGGAIAFVLVALLVA